MFEGFATHEVRCEAATIHCRVGDRGAPLLLLHGFPQTHVHWHRLAPLLAGEFSLVIPDLRGYGASHGPTPDPHHRNHSKREMAKDMVELMSLLGHERFGIVAHDRGARVGYRLALDSPRRVSHLVSLDTVPTLDIWDAWDMAASIEVFHWTLLAQPAPVPERMMGADPAAVAAYKAAFREPEVRQGMAEDYRARARPWRRLHTAGPLRPIWEKWADDVSEIAIECGHHSDFLSGDGGRSVLCVAWSPALPA